MNTVMKNYGLPMLAGVLFALVIFSALIFGGLLTLENLWAFFTIAVTAVVSVAFGVAWEKRGHPQPDEAGQSEQEASEEDAESLGADALIKRVKDKTGLDLDAVVEEPEDLEEFSTERPKAGDDQ